MKKSGGGLKYVKDFEFPADQGFTGSAGKKSVKGYMRGGSVKGKNTSGEFKQKRGKQDSMDHGTVPANKGSNQMEKEAGGRKRLKPGFKKGGYARALPEGALATAIKTVKTARSKVKQHVQRAAGQTRRATRGSKSPDHTKGKGRTRKGMPKNVKARGGEVNLHPSASRRAVGTTRSARGGPVGKQGADR